MMHSSTYEFPYSGSHTSSIPFLNYNPNQYSNFDMYNTPQITMNRGNNTVVYHLPDNIPLDLILRELGIDVDSLNQSSSRNYSTSTPISVDFIFPPPHRRRRRRIICHEVTDSESDDDSRHASPYHHRRHHHSGFNGRGRSPASIHNLLDGVWQRAKKSSQSSMSNMNSQRKSTQNKSNQTSGDLPSLFGTMKSGSGNVNQPLPGPQQYQQAATNFPAGRNPIAGPNQPNPAVANVWNRSHNIGQYGSASNLNPPWNQMSGGAPQQPPVSMHSLWGRMSGAPPPPQQPPPMNSAWNSMSGPPSPQRSPPPMNPLWNQMSGASPPPPPTPPMNPAWNQMSGASPPPPPPPPMNPAWNQMSGPPPPQQSPPSTNSLWNRMTGASPPSPQPSSPPMNPAWNQMSGPPPQQPPPAMNSLWNQMSGTPPPPQQPSPGMNSFWNQMSGAPSQQGPYSSGAPSPFTSSFGQTQPHY